MLKNYSGEIYGNIEVLEITNKKKKGYVVYKCKCNQCGRIFEDSLVYYRLRAKKGIKNITCGCYDRRHNHLYKNGLSNTKLCYTYFNMKSRCYNPNNTAYKHYGGRGIKICDEWLDKENGFLNFYNWAMQNDYKEDLTLDRIDVNGNYEPLNCRWITLKEQADNKTNTIKIQYNGITKNLTEWAREYKIPIVTLRTRISRGWDLEKALTEKVHKNFKGKHSKKYYKYNNLEEI